MGVFLFLLLVVIVFNGMVFLGGVLNFGDFQEIVFIVLMIFGEFWEILLGGFFGFVGIFFFIFEFIKLIDIGSIFQINQVFLLIVFMICLVEFVFFKGFGNDVFFVLLLMSFIDVVVGYIVVIRVVCCDYGIG